jgi:prepilin-type N-terminal cleavage/methylation domain-containing protein
MKPMGSPANNDHGMTLMELMIAVVLIGIGILASVSTFNGISQSVQTSKAGTLAANIAQEQMQIIMQKSYYEVLVTTLPVAWPGYTPNIYYDSNYFVPQTLVEGGMTFTRLTLVQVVQESCSPCTISVLAPLTPDTGMRLITVTVVWTTVSGNKSYTIQNVLNNPNTVMSNTFLSGTVKDAATSAPITNALVNAAENIGWQDTTNASGNFLINLVLGSFNFQASAPGYYTQIIPLTIGAGGVSGQTFSLTEISSGTLIGTAWLDNHLVISQVVAATSTVSGGAGGNQDVEYIELYNPTTSSILIGLNAHSPSITPVLWDASNTGYIHSLYYVNTSVPADGFYLISNTGLPAGGSTSCSTFTVAGVQIAPDACWKYYSAPNHVIECGAEPCSGPSIPDAGGVSIGNSNAYTAIPGLVNLSNWPAASIDSVAWSKNASGHSCPSDATEGTCISSTNGLWIGEQYIRRTDTGTVINPLYGRAYDGNNDSVDFLDNNPLTIGAHTTATILPPLTGTPALGAIVSASDQLSVPSSATLYGIPGNYSNPPYAEFSVPGVATGTWSVFIDSGNASAEIDNVVVVGSSTISIPNSVTSPSGSFSTVLTTNGVTGIINGLITNDVGVPIPGGISVNIGAYNTTTAANGSFYVRLATGTYDVIANPNNANASYATQDHPGVIVSLGNVTQDVQFWLPQGGKINGWITRDGVNPLPGVTVVALDPYGSAHDTEVSGTNGQFLLLNLTTGTYTVEPILDPKESSSPSSIAVSLTTPGLTVWSSTFTVAGALGTVTGSVTVGGQLIQSGVLIVISTGTLSLPLPTLSSSTLTSGSIYADSSNESGTYSVGVRGSTTSLYNISAFYMTLNGQTPVISTKTITGVTVTAGATTSGENLAW